MNLEKYIRSIPNYPKKGILFRDITSLLEHKEAFQFAIQKMKAISKKIPHTKIAAIESRGFVFASALAYLNKRPLVLLRKKNKLPGKTISQNLISGHTLKHLIAALAVIIFVSPLKVR